ncbi:MAG: amino acid ABC transporter permease [Parvibaculaceae bacterium]
MNLDYLHNLDFGIAWEYRRAILSGLQVTLLYFVLAGMLGMIGALLLVFAGRSSFRLVRWLAIAFVEVFRNTPLFVQLIWVHFALPGFTGVDLSLFESSSLVLSLNAAAYMSEIVRAGIDAVPRGQWEACHALGVKPYITWSRIVLPQAFRLILPTLANLMVSLLKGTSILSIISVAELMRMTTRISTHTARPVEMLTISALLYFIVGLIVLKGFSILEKRTTLRTS